MNLRFTIYTVAENANNLMAKDAKAFAFEWQAQNYIAKKYPRGAYIQPNEFVSEFSLKKVISWIELKWSLFKAGQEIIKNS